MQIWQYLLLGAIGAGILLLMALPKINRLLRRKQRDFTRRLETLLLPKEEITVICPGKPGHWILTNKRLVLEEGEAFSAFPFKNIKKISGTDETGKATAAAGKMVLLTVETQDRVLTLRRKGEDFTVLVKELKAKVAGQKRKTASKKKSAK